MRVYYTLVTGSDVLQVYVHPNTRGVVLSREEARRVAERIASEGGYARIVADRRLIAEFGTPSP